jgi:hypothetical protein
LAGFVLLVQLAFAPAAVATRHTSGEELRVLFVGNSYTNHNDLPQMVERMAASDGETAKVEADLVFLPGATLKRHWRLDRAAEYLRDGNYTHVVLQGHSLDTIKRPGKLATYIRKFADVAEETGTEAVLYATWARHPDNPLYVRGTVGDNPAEMQQRIDTVYGRIAQAIDAAVAPVGRAWLRALRAHPDLKLHRADGSHPTETGSYLAAAVLYGALTDAPPTQATYRPDSIDAPRARQLRQIAAGTLEAE